MNFILLILIAYLIYMFVAGVWAVFMGLLFLLALGLAFTSLPNLITRWERRRSFSDTLTIYKIRGKKGGYFSREREIEALTNIFSRTRNHALPEPGPESTAWDRAVFNEDQESYNFYESRRRLISYGWVEKRAP